MTGRPTKLDEKITAEIAEQARAGLPAAIIADVVGISRRTFFSWKARGAKEPDSIYGQFLHSLKKAEAELMRECLQALLKGEPNWQSRAWILERKWPEIWSRHSELLTELKRFLKGVLKTESTGFPETAQGNRG